MERDRVEGYGKQFKGKLEKLWGDLTDDDLRRIAGRPVKLEGKIEERCGAKNRRFLSPAHQRIAPYDLGPRILRDALQRKLSTSIRAPNLKKRLFT